MRINFKIVAGMGVIFCLGFALFTFKRSLSEEQALTMIYENYDPVHKNSTWENIPFPNKIDASSYFEERKGLVNAIFFKSYHEDGKHKIFLVTKTIPTNIPFECHACLPLIGAAVFVKKQFHWEIEAQNQFIMYDGEYGEPPVMKLIEIGKQKFGLSLEFEHGAIMNRELNLLVPYKDTIVNAFKEVIYYEHFHDCEDATKSECENYTVDITFDNSVKGDFYGLQTKKSVSTHKDQKTSYQFMNGEYAEVKK